MTRDSILAYLVYACVALGIGFLASWGIVEAWVLFWDYGWVWNKTTVPPLVLWNIFFTNIILICVLAGILAGVILAVLVGYYGG